MILPYSVYVLFSHKDQQLYIGYSTNLVERIRAHNAGTTLSTKGRRPLELIYCEYHISETDALRRESYFKTSSGKKALKLMLRESLTRFNYRRI